LNAAFDRFRSSYRGLLGHNPQPPWGFRRGFLAFCAGSWVSCVFPSFAGMWRLIVDFHLVDNVAVSSTRVPVAAHMQPNVPASTTEESGEERHKNPGAGAEGEKGHGEKPHGVEDCAYKAR